MLKTLTTVNSLLKTSLAVVVVGALGAGGWFGYRAYHSDKWALKEAEDKLALQDSQIQNLNHELSAKLLEIERLETALRLLKVDHRVARVDVLSQAGSVETGDLATVFSFVELGPEGQPLEQPRTFTVKGDLVYLDAWVIKFSDEHVEMGDPLRSTSVCLFRRIFGEAQQPKDGFVIDPVGSSPTAYRSGGKMSELEQEIWSRFWDYANSPSLAEDAGVRAAHGEAPSIKLRPGKRYKVTLRASGGLTITPEDAPPPHADQTL